MSLSPLKKNLNVKRERQRSAAVENDILASHVTTFHPISLIAELLFIYLFFSLVTFDKILLFDTIIIFKQRLLVGSLLWLMTRLISCLVRKSDNKHTRTSTRARTTSASPCHPPKLAKRDKKGNAQWSLMSKRGTGFLRACVAHLRNYPRRLVLLVLQSRRRGVLILTALRSVRRPL